MRTLHVTARLIAASLAAALAAGCTVSKTDAPITLAVEAPIAIDVVSFNGDVVITADRRLREATLEVRREATHGALPHEEMEAAVPQIQYSYELSPGETGPTLRVKTWTTYSEPASLRANIRITAPAVHGVSVQTERGDVLLTEISGPVDIETASGRVTLRTNLAMLEDVTIDTKGGEVEYRVRAESSGSLDFRAERGDVTLLAPLGHLIVRAQTADSLVAVFNEGTNAVRLRATDGDVKFVVQSSPLKQQ